MTEQNRRYVNKEIWRIKGLEVVLHRSCCRRKNRADLLCTTTSCLLKVDIISVFNAIQDFRRGNIMAEKDMRNFALRDGNGNEIGVFTGKSPRHTADQICGS